MHAKLDPLFANHLAFLGTHRGMVTVERDAVRVEGCAPFLSSWTPLHPEAELPISALPVRLIPASGDGWGERLRAAGYAPAECLAYMALPDHRPLRGLPPPNDLDIARVRTEADARAFAGVQAAAFLKAGEPKFDWWVRCFDEMARANYAREDQIFLLAREDGVPAAVLLSVRTGVTGLYAVATAPPFQHKGLSTFLLHHVRRESDDDIILQAMVGSYAHGFYARLGFTELYRSQIWRHPATESE